MRFEVARLFLLAVLMVLGGVIAFSTAAFADRRVALVVGNSQYRTANEALANPRNDAQDVATELTSLGFEVITERDATKQAFDAALVRFARSATNADSALFFYAGHAMQYQGRNYLMPVDAELEDEVSLRYNMVAMDDVRAALDRANGVKIMILDACRNNPLADNFLRTVVKQTRNFEASRGLARVDKTQGMVIAYATAPDDVALDGTGRNSPFTSALLKRMLEPGLEIEMMFRRITSDVNAQTGGRQRPETYISLLSEYYLNQNDRLAWEKIQDSGDIASMREFITRFPTSVLAQNAQHRIDILERAARERQEKDALAIIKEQAAVEAAKRREIEERLARLEADRLNAQRLEAEQEASRQRAEQERQAKAEADRKKAAEDEEKQAAQRRDEQERLTKLEEKRQKAAAEVAALEEAKRRLEATEQAAKAEAEKQAAARLAAEREAARQKEAADQAAKVEAEKQAAQLAAEREAARQKVAAEQAAKAEGEKQAARLAAEREAAHQKEAAEQAAKAEAEKQAARVAAEREAARQREAAEQEARAEAEKQAARVAAEREAAHQKEAAEKLAKIEEEKRHAAREAAEQEAARQREIAEREKAERVCKDEDTKLGSISVSDIASLQTFVTQTACDDIRAKAQARIDTIQTQQQRAEQTCKREQEKLALLQSAGAKDQLRVFEKELTCERLRPIVQAALSPPAASVDTAPEDTPELIRNAQSQLRRIGCFDGENDGVLDDATVNALKDYLARRGQRTDEPKVTPTLLSKIKAETSRVCPLVCPPGKYADGERCLAERHHEEVPERPRARHEKRQHEREARRPPQAPRPERASTPRPAREPAQAESRPAAIPSAHAIGVGF
jgi:Caspase domain